MRGEVFLNRVGREVLQEKLASDHRGPEVGPRLMRCTHGLEGRPPRSKRERETGAGVLCQGPAGVPGGEQPCS